MSKKKKQDDTQLLMSDIRDIKLPSAITVEIGSLKPHPKNYVTHTEEQLKHLIASLAKFGFYRNIVVAADHTILAGHGIWMAAQALEMKQVPIVKLDLHPNSPAAIKLLIGDNQSRQLVATDDRSMAEMLRELADDNEGLDGTGFDQMQLANFLMVTRPESEIEDFDAAAHWAGLPGFQRVHRPPTVIIHTRTEEERFELLERLDLAGEKIKPRMVCWWPPRAKQSPLDFKYDLTEDELIDALDDDDEKTDEERAVVEDERAKTKEFVIEDPDLTHTTAEAQNPAGPAPEDDQSSDETLFDFSAPTEQASMFDSARVKTTDGADRYTS
jgi:hypothetical protein